MLVRVRVRVRVRVSVVAQRPPLGGDAVGQG